MGSIEAKSSEKISKKPTPPPGHHGRRQNFGPRLGTPCGSAAVDLLPHSGGPRNHVAAGGARYTATKPRARVRSSMFRTTNRSAISKRAAKSLTRSPRPRPRLESAWQRKKKRKNEKQFSNKHQNGKHENVKKRTKNTKQQKT